MIEVNGLDEEWHRKGYRILQMSQVNLMLNRLAEAERWLDIVHGFMKVHACQCVCVCVCVCVRWSFKRGVV